MRTLPTIIRNATHKTKNPLAWRIICSRSTTIHSSIIKSQYMTQLSQRQYYNTTNSLKLDSWNTNFSRLYARRMLELLIGSTLYHYGMNNDDKKVLCDAAAGVLPLPTNIDVTKPANWLDYDNKPRRNWTNEMLDSLGTSSIGRWTLAFKRMFNLTLLASPCLILVPLSYLPIPSSFSRKKKRNKIKYNHETDNKEQQQQEEEITTNSSNYYFHDVLWNYCLYAIDVAGPTFIKFIQWATTRQDLFSTEFCEHFGQLQDSTRNHSWYYTEELLEKELGPNWKEYIQLEEEESNTTTNTTNPIPIGSGCIAQVYKGTLVKPTPTLPAGTTIAIKVQHPNIWNKVCIDFFVLQHIADFLESIPYLSLDYVSIRDCVDQFASAMLPQLDLNLEAKHLDRFIKDFANNNRVNFPVPIHELTTSKVLIETFCYGTPILQYGQNCHDTSVRKDLAMLGLETTLQMIFLHDFIHGDLHPGNILVHQSTEGKKMCMTLLDCGLVIEFGPSQHETVVKILGAFTRRQGRHAGQLMVDTTKVKTSNKVDIERFISGIEKIIVEDAEQGNFVEHIGDYVTDICYLACRHRVKLDASFINAALSVEIMEGIASTLCPGIPVVSTAMPLVMKAELMHRLPVSWWKYRTE